MKGYLNNCAVLDGTKGGKMKLEIKIDEKSYIESYLSMVSLGALECIDKGLFHVKRR